MNVSTAGKKSQSIRITAAAVLLAGAGAGLSGCVADPYYNGPGYSQGYGQPA